MIESTLRHVEAGGDLSMEQMCRTISSVMEGLWTEDQIARLLVALNRKGPAVAEVAGAAAALRSYATRIRTRRKGVMDTCGTGGDGTQTFNISTAAAFVVAAAGVPVAKHGNRGVTSRSGSADVVRALGVRIDADVSRVEACLEELGLCFCFAPLFHTAIKRVAAVRQRLGVPTIFNLLGPLANPARADFQLIGVGRPSLRPVLAEALAMLGVERAAVVHGEDGLDEVTLGGRTWVSHVVGQQVTESHWTPKDFGLDAVPYEALVVPGPAESAAVIQNVLAGQPGPARNIVLANAAAALWLAGRGPTVADCVGLAAEAIDRGKARELLHRLVEYTNA